MASADQLISNLQGIEAGSFASEAERVRAKDALIEALRKVQTPWDIAWDHNWVNGATNAAIKTLIDAGVFVKWAEAGGEPITTAKLAELTGADAQLLSKSIHSWRYWYIATGFRTTNRICAGRMLRTVAGQLLIHEVAQDTYARTPWAKALAEDSSFPGMYGGFYHELNNPMFRTLPYYLKETGFKNPTNVDNCNFQYWRGAGANMFQYVGTNPLLTSDFNDAMECHSKYNLTPWPEVYPTETVIEAAKPGRPLVVDIGGGKGHDLKKFHAKHPEIPAGSLVLQDLGDILKGVEAADAIAIQPYDFFTPQPVRGSRVYFMHNVLHDWPDATAVQILRNVAAGMEKGYSRLLVHESLVSSVKPLLRVCVSDITMMACLAAHERSETEWDALISSAGLRIVKIWRPPHSVESVIEAELV